MSEFDDIAVEIRSDNIAEMTLNRADKKNALTPEIGRNASEALEAIETDARVLILTGAGDAFCGGMDLEKYFLEPRQEDAAKFMQGAQQARGFFKDLYRLDIPTIAKINGWTFGAGYEVQGVCDFAIATEDATFGLSEINFDIFPAGGTMWTAVHTMNRRKAMYYAATGETFTGEEAEQMGAITEAVPESDLDSRVAELAESLCEYDPSALRFNKQVLEKVRYMEFEDAVDYESTKIEQMNYLQGSGWLDEALPKFRDDEFRPGVEYYKEGDTS